MKNNTKNILVIFAMVFVVLSAACDYSTTKSNAELDNHSQNNHSTDVNDDSSNVNSIESDSNVNNKVETNKKEDNSNNVPVKEEDSPTNNTEESLKEEYLEKLNDAKRVTKGLEALDSSTYALQKVESDRLDIWDELLNEIYGVLNEQLPQDEMDQLREEQRGWIEYRDNSALEASQKYKGGTQENLEYVAVLANLTEERSFELVEDYMK
ncbi:lysozyme inhibitor LprI family protein [Alkalibacillus haloalkaliphilus]|uniref:lysozyme inhibitor LprI family protein n=1 Tax=Alkalibacillus haloalkaliphilus TaxID=94136 RepID=UPI0002E7DA1C|nr:lysozyme inhibitor LprI family protein [Alkalibacillus haloalkaliphilus]